MSPGVVTCFSSATVKRFMRRSFFLESLGTSGFFSCGGTHGVAPGCCQALMAPSHCPPPQSPSCHPHPCPPRDCPHTSTATSGTVPTLDPPLVTPPNTTSPITPVMSPSGCHPLPPLNPVPHPGDATPPASPQHVCPPPPTCSSSELSSSLPLCPSSKPFFLGTVALSALSALSGSFSLSFLTSSVSWGGHRGVLRGTLGCCHPPPTPSTHWVPPTHPRYHLKGFKNFPKKRNLSPKSVAG